MSTRIQEIESRRKAVPGAQWRYDDGITDETTGERGKTPTVECLADGRHMLIAYPDACDLCEETVDAIGRFIAHAPTDVDYLVSRLQAMERVMRNPCGMLKTVTSAHWVAYLRANGWTRVAVNGAWHPDGRGGFAWRYQGASSPLVYWDEPNISGIQVIASLMDRPAGIVILDMLEMADAR